MRTNIFERVIHYIARKAVYGPKANSKSYLQYLRRIGANIGDGTIFFNPTTVMIDETVPFLVTIGDNCQITGGVTVLTHDYGWSTIKAVYGEVLGSIRAVEIGNNVYIGMNAIILAGSKVGNNVVIGANSVVSGVIPDNCVAVGSPAKPIYSLEEYYNKRKKAQLNEAVDIINCYVKKYGVTPPEETLSEHFWLFSNKDGVNVRFDYQNRLMPGSEDVTLQNFKNHNPLFESYQELVQYALKRNEE